MALLRVLVVATFGALMLTACGGTSNSSGSDRDEGSMGAGTGAAGASTGGSGGAGAGGVEAGGTSGIGGAGTGGTGGSDGAGAGYGGARTGGTGGVNIFQISALAQGTGRFVGVGYESAGGEGNGFIYASPDGDIWTRVAEISSVHDVAFGNDRFVAVGGYREGRPLALPNRAFVSSDGVAWESFELPPEIYAGGLEFGEGYFVTATGGGNALRSTDGVTWEVFPTSVQSDDVAFALGRFVISGELTESLRVSDSGETWEMVSLSGVPPAARLSMLFGLDDGFAGLTSSGGDTEPLAWGRLASTNGIDWTYASVTDAWLPILVTDTACVSASGSEAGFRFGGTCDTQDMGSTAITPRVALAHEGTLLVAGNGIATSHDGVSWTVTLP